MTQSTHQGRQEHPFAAYVRILGKGKKGTRSLNETEAYDAMSMILKNEVEDLQLGAFLMLMRVKEESPEELAGFINAVKDQSGAPNDLMVDLDWSSYAGKRRHLPWFVFSIILLADAGYRIFIHGASGHTSNRMYTEDLFESLKLPVSHHWDEARTQLNNANFTYMPLRYINARLEEMINMRPILGLRSPVHSLSRLINPLNARVVLQGIFHPPYSGLHQKAAKLLNYPSVAVIKGEGGEIERNPDNDMTVYSCRNGALDEETWPAMFPRRHVKAQEMSPEYMQKLWQGELEDEYAWGAITSTTALALRELAPELSQEAALQKADTMWKERDLHRFA